MRVALARAVVTRPKVRLFDEPLSNLDAQLRERMRDELRAIQLKFGITSLYVTHDQSEAMAISDRVVVMRNGMIEQDDAPPVIYARPKTEFVARFMGCANILSAPVVRREGNEVGPAIAGETVAAPLGGGDYHPGDTVRCVLRPEHARLDASGSRSRSGASSIRAATSNISSISTGRNAPSWTISITGAASWPWAERSTSRSRGAPLWIIGPASDEAQSDKAA
jgi:ABC-type Fe3+/spermidine/putrescine transport system ATPase subunit